MYDVIVVGGGPGGSSAAYHCAKKGLKVLLLDQRKKIGVPKQCAEGINEDILKELDLKLRQEWISKKTNSWVLFNFKNYLKFKGRRNRGFVLERKKFDADLAERARKAGAELKLNRKVTDLTKEGVICMGKEIKGRVIIGADGPNTVVGEKSGLGKPKCGFGLQYEIKTKKTDFPNSMQCYLDSDLVKDGWFWVFPKKESLNVGVGSFTIKELKPALDVFVKKLRLKKEKVLETNAGLIPLYGPLNNFCNERVLLIGDAAGHTNPISGGGIPAAIFGGILAAKVIKEHFEKKVPLTNFQKEWWRSNFGKATTISLKAKKIFFEQLKKDGFNLLLERAGDREINKVMDLFYLALKMPLLDVLMSLMVLRSFLKYYKYAW